MAAPLDLEAYLEPFRLSSFRPGQREVIETVLAGHDCLCVMPTGGGKSLCYQLPAIAQTGLTLVVSPLIALMKDQVDRLAALGLPATFINSTLTPDEQGQRLERMAAGEYRLVYVVPERFRSPRFLDAVGRSQLRLLAIDEAHCVSEWGHDFRPDYAKLGRFRTQLGSPPTIALTATATTAVRRDIVQLLGMREPKTFITGFARPNLHYEVLSPGNPREKDELLIQFLAENPGSGIVYASTRKRCEEVAELVASRARRRTGIYHAGLQTDERRGAQEKFMSGQHEIVVATLAFGMGIDKADLRFIVHYNMPGSLEAYYQEAGRGGRDGQPAHCLLLYSPGDRYLHEFFIESAYPSRDVVKQVYDFLCQQRENPIELTQQDIKEQLGLQIGGDGIGACEKLLEQAGALDRLESTENQAALRINSDLPTLVDLLPGQAKVKRRLMRAIERMVNGQRREWYYFQPRELAARAESDWPAVARNLRELAELEAFDYVPAFRGRALHMPLRNRPFASWPIDFETSERRKTAEYERLGAMLRYAQSRGCRQGEILNYFGEIQPLACGHCDNCSASQPAAGGSRATADAELGVISAVRIVLSGVARARGRCGKTLLAQMLCGSNSEKVTRNRLDRLSTYGLLSHLRQTEVVELIDALMAARYLEQIDVDRFRPVLQITPRGQDVMSGRVVRLEQLSLATALFEKLRRNTAKPQDTSQAAPPAMEADETNRIPSTDSERSAAIERRPVPASQTTPVPAVAGYQEGSAETPFGPEAAFEQWLEETSAEPTSAEIAQARPASERAAPAVGAMATGNPVSPVEEPAAQPPAPVERPDDSEGALPRQADSLVARPSHYWTWRLLAAGFSPDECAAIRNLSADVVLDHALRAIDTGWAVEAGWFLAPKLIARLDSLLGTAPPARIRPLLARLPRDTRYEHVQLYVKCRFPGAVAAAPTPDPRHSVAGA